MILGIDASRANRDNKTGVEWYAWHLIENMKKNTPDNVRVVLYSDKPLKGELAILPKNWECKILSWSLGMLWTQIRLSSEILTNKPDILFIPSHVFPIVHPKKTVMTVHDIAASKFPENYSLFQKWYTLWSAKYAVNKLWRVIVPSKFTKDELLKVFGLDGVKNIENKIHVVHHGYDNNYKKIYDTKKIDKVLKKYNIRKPFLLTVGRLEKKKNTKAIIQAFNNFLDKGKYKDHALVLVGNKGFGYGEIKRQISESPYKERIILPGWVEVEDLVCIMNSADVFLFPSLYEGFGMPILEAMASGVPVVASSGTGLDEVGKNSCKYVNKNNTKEIADVIIGLLDNPEYKNNLVRSGLERVNDFSWDKCAKETFEVLKG
jgi:glycosyltransferase involved in cell wall biosynthesis